MDPQAIAALVNLGVAGVGLYLFATGKLRAKVVDDEARTDADERLAEQRVLYDARIAEFGARYLELRADRDSWKALAMGTERRLDVALPTVATALGAAVPSTERAPEAGK